MGSRWVPLKVGQDGVPPLLVKSSFRPKGYAISVTDLGCLWSENLDREEIIKRAFDDKTSVDPSEGDSQLKILLDKIEHATQGKEDTTIELTNDGNHGLILVTTAALPPPLASLRWVIRLSLASQETFKHEVVFDLLAASYLQGQYIADLKKQLNEKDHLISKLLDRQESSGMDISTVFPGTAGLKHSSTKGTTREQAGRIVRGLAPFDEKRSWENAVPKRSQDVSIDDFMHRVCDLDGSSGLSHVKSALRESDIGSWWDKLGSLDAVEVRSRERVSQSQARRITRNDVKKITREESDLQDGSDFQRQPTPDRLKSKTSSNRPQSSSGKEKQDNVDGDTTDDGGNQSDTTKTRSVASDVANETVNEESDREPEIADSEKIKQQVVSAPRPKKMGVIGGRRAQPPSLERNVTDRPVSSGSASSTVSPAKPKLGTIGGRKKGETFVAEPSAAEDVAKAPNIDASAAIPQPKPNEEIPRTTQPKAAEPPPENSQEKADRLREALKHELEEKSKVQPKKKRRF